MSHTPNCIVCARNIKRTPATFWTGFVVMFDEAAFIRRQVEAGFCNEHREDARTMPDHTYIVRGQGCRGLWTGDMGINMSEKEMAMKKKLVPVVRQDPEKEVPVEVLAESIKAISAGIKKLRQGPLQDDALYLMIQHAAPKQRTKSYGAKTFISTRVIKAVIQGMESLEKEFLK